MAPDDGLIVIFASLHLVALVLGGLLFAMFLRSEGKPGSRDDAEEDDGGGGGNDRISDRPKNSPSGGIPLPDAEPAPFRPRSPDRPPRLRERPARRRVLEPARPDRVRPRAPAAPGAARARPRAAL